MQFAFDIETLGIESNSIVLSAAIIYFDLDERPTLNELIDRALFVKFDAVEQKKAGRLITPSTLTWWKEQHEYIRKLSFVPRDDDYSMADGIEELRKYVTKYGNGKGDMMWARGGLDQMAIESLEQETQLLLKALAEYRVEFVKTNYLGKLAPYNHIQTQDSIPFLWSIYHDILEEQARTLANEINHFCISLTQLNA